MPWIDRAGFRRYAILSVEFEERGWSSEEGCETWNTTGGCAFSSLESCDVVIRLIRGNFFQAMSHTVQLALTKLSTCARRKGLGVKQSKLKLV